MRVRPGDDWSWRGALAAALPGPRGGEPRFTLYSAVAKTSAWADRAPLPAWDRSGNARSLRADVEVGLAMCGPAFLGLFHPTGAAVVESLRRVAAGSRAHRGSDVNALGEVARRAEGMLRTPSLRVSAWHDLTDAARADPPDLTVIEDRVALLNAILAAAGIDPGPLFGRLANVLNPYTSAVSCELSAALVDCTDEQRVHAGAALLHDRPPQDTASPG